MSERAMHKLKILPEFKNLIRPLKKKEYLQLEANILSDGCRDPIVVWKRYIIDGHNRYEICMRHGIPSDREKLGKLLNISNEQMSFITNAEAGCGLIKYGSALVPFVTPLRPSSTPSA